MYVHRDPFAREELHKFSLDGTCDFCGGSNKNGKVYRFETQTDGGRTFKLRGKFCSKTCLKSYNE